MTESGSDDEQARPDSAAASAESRSRREVQGARRKAHRHPLLRRGAIIIASGMVLILVVSIAAYVKLNGNITKVDVSSILGERPKAVVAANKETNLQPVNILVLGSDTRDLGTSKYGTTPGQRADTTLVVHLSADRRSAVVVSVPRDSMTHAPKSCKAKDSVKGGPMRMWNANYSLGGAGCVQKTFEGLTGIRIDHYMVVNFLGFKSMVNALGSVEVCLPEAVNDPKSHLKLPKGRSRVSGEQALDFVRVRYNIGVDGSDLGRIDRQQAFLSSMVQEATSAGLLLRPDKLFRFLDAATSSLTTDPELGNLNTMRELAQSAAGLKPSQIRFVTVPVEQYPPDHARVQWTSAADALWKSIREDTPLPGTKRAPGSRPTATSTATAPVLTVAPDKITVKVVNDSGVAGLARQAADDLRIQGFNVSSYSTGSNDHSGVTVAYSAANEEAAKTVAAAFPGAKMEPDAAAGDVIRVSLGSGSPNVVEVSNRLGGTALPQHTLTATKSATPSSTETIKARTADADICGK